MSNEWEEFRKEMASMRAYLEKDIPQKNAVAELNAVRASSENSAKNQLKRH